MNGQFALKGYLNRTRFRAPSEPLSAMAPFGDQLIQLSSCYTYLSQGLGDSVVNVDMPLKVGKKRKKRKDIGNVSKTRLEKRQLWAMGDIHIHKQVQKQIYI